MPDKEFDLSRPYETRGGLEVVAWRSPWGFGFDHGLQLVGVINDPRGAYVSQWGGDGSFSNRKSEFDLVPKVDRRTGWLNVNPKPTSDIIHSTREIADTAAAPDRIACIQIHYEVPHD